MATPTTPEERLYATAAIKGAAWGTALAVGAGKGLLLTSDGNPMAKQPYKRAEEADTPFIQTGDLGDIDPVDFSPAFFMRYDPGAGGMLESLLFGTAGTPTLVGATLAYKHVFQWADSVYGKFAIYATEMPGKIYEVASAKVMGLTLNVADGFLMGSLKLRGNTVIDTSAVNTATQMDAITYVNRFNRIKFRQGSVKMNAQSGGDVASATVLELSGLTIVYDRKFDTKHVAGSSTIIEPNEEGYPEIKIKLSMPRFNSVNAAFLATLKAETPQKMLIKFTGALIETGFYYDRALYFPRVVITNFESKKDKIVTLDIDLDAEQAATAPTGMIYVRPYEELVNLQTTDYQA